MINIIKSKDNDKIKYTKSLLKTKGRTKEKKFIIEGYRILTLALECDAKLEYVFINEDFVLRPMAGKRIMDIFLDPKSKLSVCRIPNITSDVYDKLEKMSMDFAYDMFLDLKEKQLQKNEENYNKYMYALQLRIEAAEHIGIKNIRESKFTKIQNEKQTIEQKYEIGKQIYPDFRLMIMVRLEV